MGGRTEAVRALEDLGGKNDNSMFTSFNTYWENIRAGYITRSHQIMHTSLWRGGKYVQ